MQIYLVQNGVQAGPFSLEEAQKMVRAGQHSLSDYAWHQGLAQWVPLSRIFSGNTSSVPPPFPPIHPVGPGWKRAAEMIFAKITGEITTVAGVERIEGLSGKDFFSEVLRKRKDDEMEEIFITGTRSATPLLKDIDTHWPHPWVFFKTVAISLFIFGGFYIGSVSLDNGNMIPGAILVGSFAIPCSALIFFMEMNVARNFSVYQTIKLVFLGGLFALLLAIFLGNVILPQTDSQGAFTWVAAAITGLVEESAKMLAVIVLMGKRRFNWSLNGLLIGAAVGAGFAAFESAGYALHSLLGYYRLMLASKDPLPGTAVVPGMIHVIEERALLASSGHILWTALAAAALWKVKGDHPFRIAMLLDLRFLRMFFIVVVLHTLWDSPWDPPFAMGYIFKDLLLGAIAWVAVFGYIQDGLKQIRIAQRALPTLPPEPLPAGSPRPSMA